MGSMGHSSPAPAKLARESFGFRFSFGVISGAGVKTFSYSDQVFL